MLSLFHGECCPVWHQFWRLEPVSLFHIYRAVTSHKLQWTVGHSPEWSSPLLSTLVSNLIRVYKYYTYYIPEWGLETSLHLASKFNSIWATLETSLHLASKFNSIWATLETSLHLASKFNSIWVCLQSPSVEIRLEYMKGTLGCWKQKVPRGCCH